MNALNVFLMVVDVLLAVLAYRTATGRWAMRGLALGAAVIGVVWVLGRKDQRD